MKTIEATYQNGVFTPDGSVDLTEGIRVTLRVEPAQPKSGKRSESTPFMPDALLEPEDQGAPFDLPLAVGVSVRAQEGSILLPDPPICRTEIE